MRPIIVFVLGSALMLGGCMSGGDGSPAPGPGPVAGAEARNETTTIPISVQAAASPPAGPVGRTGAAGEVAVEANATGLIVEAQWTCTSPTCAFDLVVLDPEGTEVGRGSGSGDARVEVGNVTNGTYAVQLLYASPAIASANGDIHATVFYGAAPPSGFTAFGEGHEMRRSR